MKFNSKFFILGVIAILLSNNTSSQTNLPPVNITKNPILIRNLEVAQMDLPERLTWINAITVCANLGEGWRLPSRDEIEFFRESKEIISGLKVDPKQYYWAYNESVSPELRLWANCFYDNGTLYGEAEWYLNVRPVRTRNANSKINDISETQIDSLIKFKIGSRIYRDTKYTSIKKIGDNRNAVAFNGKWAIANENWVLITPVTYDDIGVFENCGNTYNANCDITTYDKEGKRGYINTSGHEITPPIYSKESETFVSGIAYVKLNDLWGAINLSGNLIIPCKYVSIQNRFLYKGYNAIGFTDNKSQVGVYTNDGKLLIPFKKGRLVDQSELGSINTGDDFPPIIFANGKYEIVYASRLNNAAPRIEETSLQNLKKKLPQLHKYFLSYQDNGNQNSDYVNTFISGTGSNSRNSQNKSTENTNQAYNINESSDCKDIVNAYELAVRKNITALKKIRNGAMFSKSELYNLDNDIRKWQVIVMKQCAYEPKYANRVLYIMEQLQLGHNSTFPPIKINSSTTSSNSKSSSQSLNQSSNSIKNGGTNNQLRKIEKKEVDLSLEVLSQIVSCKSCSSPVNVQINVPRSDELKKSFNQIGGITSSMCGKCHKTSSFTYEMKAGKFVKIN